MMLSPAMNASGISDKQQTFILSQVIASNLVFRFFLGGG